MRPVLLFALLIAVPSYSIAQPPPGDPDARSETLGRIRALRSTAVRPWRTLDTLAQLAAGTDRSLAAPAALTASGLAHAFDAFDVEREEIALASLRSSRQRWLRLATDTQHWVDIRIYALDVASRLRSIVSRVSGRRTSSASDIAAWRKLLGDEDPQMRAAALSLMPSVPELLKVAQKLARDANSAKDKSGPQP